MACTLADARRGTLGARTNALQGGSLVSEGALHDQRFSAQVVVVLGIGHCGVQRLLDGFGNAAVGEAQDVLGFVSSLE